MNLSKILCCLCCLLSAGKVFGSNKEKINFEKLDTFFKGAQIPYEVVLVGDPQVGKTQIINRSVKNEFDGGYQATIGVDFSSKTFEVQKKTIKMQIWDAAGQEKFKTLIPTYTKNAKAIVFVYDVSNKQSFENLNKWLENVKSVNNNPLYFLVGNKTDLRDNNNNGKEQVTTKEGENFANNNNMIFLGEVSAEEGENINEIFEAIVKKCLKEFNSIDNVRKSDIKVINNKENTNNNYNYIKYNFENDYFINNNNDIENINNNINTKISNTNGNEESCWKNFCSCCSKLAFWKKKKERVNEDMINKIGNDWELKNL